jgi:hypothetical protein
MRDPRRLLLSIDTTLCRIKTKYYNRAYRSITPPLCNLEPRCSDCVSNEPRVQ